MNILQYGGGGVSGPADYAIVSNQAGQLCAPGDPHELVIDAITHLGASFSAVVGDPLVHLAIGVYLVFCDVYVVGSALGGGYEVGWPGSDYMLLTSAVPCVSSASDTGESLGLGLIVATSPAIAWINAKHSDTVDRPLAGDLCVMRLGGL